MLLAHRVENKIKASKVDDVLNRLHLAEPVKRDAKVRAPFIPDAILSKREGQMEVERTKKKLERDIELEQGHNYFIDLRSKLYIQKKLFITYFI